MWDDHKQLNALALTLVASSRSRVALIWATAVTWAGRQPILRAARGCASAHRLKRANAAQLRGHRPQRP